MAVGHAGFHHSSDRSAQFGKCAKAPVAICDLVSAWDLGMWPNENRYLLTMLANCRDQFGVCLLRRGHAVRNERRVDQRRIEFDYRVTFGQFALDLISTLCLCSEFAKGLAKRTNWCRG